MDVPLRRANERHRPLTGLTCDREPGAAVSPDLSGESQEHKFSIRGRVQRSQGENRTTPPAVSTKNFNRVPRAHPNHPNPDPGIGLVDEQGDVPAPDLGVVVPQKSL